MKITKQSSSSSIKYNSTSYLLGVDNDLINIFNVLKGRVRLGSGIDGANGENISGQFQTFTSGSSANVEFSVSHTIGAIPIGWLEIAKDKPAHLYLGTSDWTSTVAYFKCDVASTNFIVFLLK